MTASQTQKPPYRVPSMEEIRAIPWNGLTVASTFSGAGGSSLGYKLAGFRVAWASEFIQAARDTYAANFPDTVLDARDIRRVKPKEILAALGVREGELDVLDGSPPCASFSTAGKRSAGWGEVKKYSDTKQRTDDLFFEYVRILRGVKPRAFVAENVSGLVKGTAKGYFLEILAALKASGYRVTAKVLDAKWLGVPQSRQRLIFVGVREDLGLDPVHPKPLPYLYTVRDALPWIVKVAVNRDDFVQASTVQASTGWRTSSTLAGEPLGRVEAYRDHRGAFGNGGNITDAPAPAVLAGSVGTHWITDRVGSRFKRVDVDVDDPMNTIQKSDPAQTRYEIGTDRRKFTIAELRRICAFPDDFILTGTYAQQWERLGRSVPPVMMQKIATALRDRLLTVTA